MATRFYAGTSSPAIVPSVHSSWEKLGNLVRLVAQTTSSGGGAQDISTSANPDGLTANTDVCLLQLVSDRLAAQTISGTIKGQMLASESAIAADARAQLHARVITKTGALRGVLLAHDTGALSSEFNTTQQNRKFPRGGAQSITSLAVQDQDRIIIEVGVRPHATTSESATLRLIRTGTDLPEDETTTADNETWFEFSGNLSFYVPPADETLSSKTVSIFDLGSSYAFSPEIVIGGTAGDVAIRGIILDTITEEE